ncbi:unnamed protein product [Protopolystoma xenopodis]|uniref:GIY-YIG domain-containing protein n=1 Tax=Protopolystoma xenopodis TaxID=117903 RepID=A0A3S5FCB8_9PLAT|nr:unnamed protein product [Protopolystoma xenopodis]
MPQRLYRKEIIKGLFQLGFYENQIRNQDDNQVDLPALIRTESSIATVTKEMEYQGNNKEDTILFTSLPTQHEKAGKLDCWGVYFIKCSNCKQKHIGETGRKIGLRIKEHQRMQEHGH